MTPSNDEKNTKNVKIEQILDSNLVITRKSRVDTYSTSYLKFLELLTNLAKICQTERVFQVKARQHVAYFIQEFSKNHRVDFKMTKYLNFSVFKLEITNQA